MTKPRVTIIGLGFIGGSIGLALKASGKPLHIIGHDIDHEKNKLAQKQKVVDESTFSLVDACQDADLVIIATPITATRETLQVIAPVLKAGCVVTDTATLKEPVIAWAAETLSESNPFVGGDPLLNPAALSDDLLAPHGLASARADLFQGAFYILSPSADVSPTAVKRVADMVTLLQARPLFADPAEHDGMRAAVEGLPVLVGLALMETAVASSGWREARKLADYVLGMATAPIVGEGVAKRAQALLNAPHVLPRIDALMQRLTQLREWIATQDAAALEAAFDQANATRDAWLRDHALGEWEEELGEVALPGAFDALGNLVGLGLGRRTKKED